MKVATLALFGSFLALSPSARAAITVIGNFHLGEADSPNVSGTPANATTKNSAGTPDLSLVGTAPVFSSLSGVSGSSLSMDFSLGGYASAAPFAVGASWGMEGWVQGDNNTADGTAHAIFYNGNSSNSGMGIYEINGRYTALLGGLAIVNGPVVGIGVWTHLAVVLSGGTTTLYVNGVSTATAGSPGAVGVGNFNIGVRVDNAEKFDGRIDEVRVFTFAPGAFSTSDLQLTSVVPEPGSVALLGLGLLVGCRRRR